jgi:hypothetical protein
VATASLAPEIQGERASYSAFDRFVRLHRARLVGMFETYCDEAGGLDHGFIAVCGWLASVERWKRFEADWKQMLAAYDVPYLHMTEFAHFNGPFEKFLSANFGPRTNFMKEATRIIRESVEFGFVCYPYGRIVAVNGRGAEFKFSFVWIAGRYGAAHPAHGRDEFNLQSNAVFALDLETFNG